MTSDKKIHVAVLSIAAVMVEDVAARRVLPPAAKWELLERFEASITDAVFAVLHAVEIVSPQGRPS